jgi:hypothetical protein
MRHKHVAGTLVERWEIAPTSSRANGVLHHPPEAFDRIEVMAAVGWQAMEAQLLLIVVEGRVELMRPMDPAPIDDHHHLCAGFAEDRHHLMEILAQFLGIKVRHNFIETNGVSRLQTNDSYSTCRSYCHGHTLPPSWAKACHPARSGGVYDSHHRVYHGLILSG